MKAAHCGRRSGRAGDLDKEQKQAVREPESYERPPNSGERLPSSTLLALPASAETPRRILWTQGSLCRSAAPQPAGFSFYAPDFFLDNPQPWLLPQDAHGLPRVQTLSAEEVTARLAPFAGAFPDADTRQWTPPLRAEFDQAFQDLQARFRAGELRKAVPVFFEQADAPPSPAEIARWIQAVLRAPAALLPYGCWTEGDGMLGASPEVLFEVHQGMLKTMALAGTLSAPHIHEAGAEQKFLADPKERREHSLVVEGIAEALAPFGAVTVGPSRILKLPSLWHLQTPIEAVLREDPPMEALVRCLHPTPALGGSPRAASVDWLRGQDLKADVTQRRGGFGAPFGVQCPDGSLFCLVAVRNVLWNMRAARIGAGCGIIAESRPEREWEELRQKRASVKRLLGL